MILFDFFWTNQKRPEIHDLFIRCVWESQYHFSGIYVLLDKQKHAEVNLDKHITKKLKYYGLHIMVFCKEYGHVERMRVRQCARL